MTTTQERPTTADKVCPRCAGLVPVLVEGTDVCIRCDGLISDGRWIA